MKRVSFLTILWVLVLAIVVLASCLNTETRKDNQDFVCGTGIIKFFYLEGGFYGIIGDDGNHYDPINLSKEFQDDGLRIRFKAKIREDVASIHMWGRPIEIIKIESLE